MPPIPGYKGSLVHPPEAEEPELADSVGQETKELQILFRRTRTSHTELQQSYLMITIRSKYKINKLR